MKRARSVRFGLQLGDVPTVDVADDVLFRSIRNTVYSTYKIRTAKRRWPSPMPLAALALPLMLLLLVAACELELYIRYLYCCRCLNAVRV